MRRAGRLLQGLVMAACAVLLPLRPDLGLRVAAGLLGVSLTLYGLRMLVYYFLMARHMVGGLMVLFLGLIAFDAGAISAMLGSHPRIAVVLYLVCGNVLAGLSSILNALEARRLGSHWKRRLTHGIFFMAHAVCCLVFVTSDFVIVALYSLGLLYGAYSCISSAFKRADIIYIP